MYKIFSLDDKPINLSRIKMKSIIHEFLSYLSDDDLTELARDIVSKQLERNKIQQGNNGI
tara:strand:+ start:178 stop:357 length:180 start_codon:yes stop_codon:yes gene_type:complete